MNEFENFYYQKLLEYGELKSDDDKEKFYSSTLLETARLIKKTKVIKTFGLMYHKTTSDAYGWCLYVKLNSDKIIRSSNAYSNKAQAMMNLLYRIHTGCFE